MLLVKVKPTTKTSYLNQLFVSPKHSTKWTIRTLCYIYEYVKIQLTTF